MDGENRGGKVRATENGWVSPPTPHRGQQKRRTQRRYWMSGRDKSLCWIVTFNNNYPLQPYRRSIVSERTTGGRQSTPSHHLKTKDWLDPNLSHLRCTRTVKKLCWFILRGLVNQIKPSVDCVLSETSNYVCWNFFWQLMGSYYTSI